MLLLVSNLRYVGLPAMQNYEHDERTRNFTFTSQHYVDYCTRWIQMGTYGRIYYYQITSPNDTLEFQFSARWLGGSVTPPPPSCIYLMVMSVTRAFRRKRKQYQFHLGELIPPLFTLPPHDAALHLNQLGQPGNEFY